MSFNEHNIKIHNAKVHNLKSICLEIPKNKITVITGPSGSGKSSLAFDTLYAEGQRRYIESLSSYARQFIGQMDPPDVESIEGLSPAIAIDQKSSSRNPRSTVGTITEIYDYMRILFAKIGKPHCPQCGKDINPQTAQQIVNSIALMPEGSKIQILSPIIKNKKGSHENEIIKILGMGFSRVRIDNEIQTLSDQLKLEKNIRHNIEVVVDRIVIKKSINKRLSDSVELALRLSGGSMILLSQDTPIFYSEKSSCEACNISFPDLEPRAFSFNSPVGACPQCNGLGESKIFTELSLIFDENLGITTGAIPVLSKKNSFNHQMVKNILESEKINLATPLNKIPSSIRKTLLYGSDKIYQFSFKSESSNFNFKKPYQGIIAWLTKKYTSTDSEKTRKDLESHMIIKTCPLCDGQRLNSFALATSIAKSSIMDLCQKNISQLKSFFTKLDLNDSDLQIAKKLLHEINSRLQFLLNVGLDYLALNRGANTLSGGEAQRIRLATQIGSALSGVLYVLDEPSIGLHAKDNEKLIQTLQALQKLNNTVIVVEHDESTIRCADHIVDLGPAAGINGGMIVAEGTLAEIMKNPDSITGKYLRKELVIPVPNERKPLTTFIKLKGASKNNLHNLDLDIPLEMLVCVTGVSGSGKSTLIHNILVPAVNNYLKKSTLDEINQYQSISGLDAIKSIIELDQSPIGRTSNSNPATYTNIFDSIRKLFSSTPESKARGYTPGRFSFNVKGGRCENCEGNGTLKIEMHFLPDVFITCSECSGKRYNNETLTILYRGKSIAEILDMDVDEATTFFSSHSKIHRTLLTLQDIGLGYIKLGQPATTLSGGEAQRLKLGKELSKRTKGHCLYVLDEPTTGLHFGDINLLLKSINNLVEQGHSVIVIEHNMNIIKSADYVIDLGPGGGDKGGKMVAQGTPEQLALESSSITGEYLQDYLL